MSEDLIKRSDAIEAVKRVSENYTGKGKRDYHPHVDFIVDELKYCVPSADRPQGEWVLDPNGMDWNIPAWRCSRCGFVANYIGTEANGFGRNPMNWAGSKYCPNCGAKMEAAYDEHDKRTC